MSVNTVHYQKRFSSGISVPQNQLQLLPYRITPDSNNSSGSTTTSSSNLIIVENDGNEKPLVLTENLPNVKGVIVVSSGANDISVKLDILNAISTLLNISTDKISVLKGI